MVLVAALLGRVHLSGRPDLLSPQQASVVRRALEVYKSYRHLLPRTIPRWPLGLPGWRDGWVCLALSTDDGTTLLALWRRDGASDTVTVPLSWIHEPAAPRVLFTAGPQPRCTWNGRERALRATLPAERSAVLLAFGPMPLR
jgi:alpha-galactosidase